MTAQLSDRFNILQRSPLDELPSPAPESHDNPGEEGFWVGSRFNAQTTAGDGRLVVWNTLTGAISVFPAKQREAVKRLLRRKPFESAPDAFLTYLFDRGFVVKEGTDEYRRFRLLAGRRHYRTDLLELTLLASEDCNFRCQYCYEGFARGTMRPHVRDGIKKMIESRIPGLRDLYIAWFGGEPLYGFEAIADLSPFFVEIAEKHSITYAAHMTTNGYLLTPDVVDKILPWRINHFQITLDGPPEFHNRKRPTRDGRGSFQQIFDNLRAMSRRPDPFTVSLRINFDRENHPYIEDFLDIVQRDLGGDDRFQIRFKSIGRWGGSNDENLPVFDGDEEARARFQLFEAAHKRGLYTTDKVNQRNTMGGQVCYAARPFHFTIGADGAVMKCTVDLDMQEANVVGHIQPDGQMILDWEKLSAWTEPDFETDERCHKCVILPICQSLSCPSVRIAKGKNPCSPLKYNLRQEMLIMLSGRSASARKVAVARDPGAAPPD